ncbi:MAG: TlyA family RNA methyltransferase [Vampirovibrio sp.]|nr:TlyA family RNA methyltransferase [Vampirovibrio sp.]
MMTTKRIRLDHALLALNLATTPQKATGLIMAGQILVNNQRITQTGHSVNLSTDVIRLKADYCHYVSRGGLKLAHALTTFQLSPENATCLDVGASTGGFTDCLLQNGGKFVYAVDVGEGLLDPKLLQNEKVRAMENCNARFLTADLFAENPPSVGVTDVSFISLKQILPPLLACLTPTETSWCVALLKPQFECLDYYSSQEAHAFDGVITDEALRERVKQSTLADLAKIVPSPWHLVTVEPSPIQGAKGNIEFLTLWQCR